MVVMFYPFIVINADINPNQTSTDRPGRRAYPFCQTLAQATATPPQTHGRGVFGFFFFFLFFFLCFLPVYFPFHHPRCFSTKQGKACTDGSSLAHRVEGMV